MVDPDPVARAYAYGMGDTKVDEFEMTDLSKLYGGLKRLRRFCRMVRIASAASMFIAPLLWALLASMALDVMTDMGRLERVVSLLIVVGIGVWAFRRFVRPAMSFEESEVETALLVEQRQQIETDLVSQQLEP